LAHVAPEGAETWFASTTAHFCTIQGHFRPFSNGSGAACAPVFQPRRSAAASGQLAVRQHSGQLIIRANQQIDEYQRVKFEFVNVKPFACLAFPLSLLRENALKQPSFGDELVTSFMIRTRGPRSPG
jgi:hypothetical protein